MNPRVFIPVLAGGSRGRVIKRRDMDFAILHLVARFNTRVLRARLNASRKWRVIYAT